MSAAGYVNRDQFVTSSPRMMTTRKLMAMPSADAPGKTVADIADAKRAARGHADMVENIREHGVDTPVMVRNGQFVDGHHRVIAAHDAKRWWVPVQEMT